ncbi:MAG: GGDEF domain-containing protein, partial [Betaproteobacteria bacterium]|nr:GGDEF domain-containing protein [Betaproteobacteria bacterium]
MLDPAGLLERISVRTAVAFSIAVLVLLVAGDSAIGRELGLAPLYLIPVMLITWKTSATMGVAVSMFAFGLWAAAILHEDGTAIAAYVLWEAAIRLATTVLFVVLLSSLKASLARASLLARKDSLTDLANRGSFYELVNQELLRCKRYGGAISIAFIDLDKFKALNDRAGHDVGDEALRVVAQTLRSQLRSTDVPARLGGDEFAVMLPGMDARGASQATQILQSRLLSAMEHRGWPITFSIGLATFTTALDSADEMIKRADMLMYQMKREGKGG